MTRVDSLFHQDPATGIYIPAGRVAPSDAQYDPRQFQFLLKMQEQHFWYLGRHRFLLRALTDALSDARQEHHLGIDLGGGCGGWIRYLQRCQPGLFQELALGDSSLDSLQMAANVVETSVCRYQLDIRELPACWRNRWDVTFLLDVLEHLEDDVQVMRQIGSILRPGGFLLVTTPALDFFWSSNDALVHHVRRYRRADFAKLADQSGLELIRTRYFMFWLSPLLVLRRLKRIDVQRLSEEERHALLEREHRIQPPWLNRTLATIFAAETPLGLRIPFPWGTSVLALFQKRH